MTGFGRGEAMAGGVRIVVDVRTVNHRFLDIDLRGAALPPRVEALVRKGVEGRLSRGRVEILVAIEATDPDAAPLRVNMAVMHALAAALRELGRESNVADEMSLADLSRLPWSRAIEAVEPVLTEEQEDGVRQALQAALDLAIGLRRREGEEIARDLAARIARIRALLAEASRESAAWPARHLARLRARMAELLAGQAIDETRLAQEAAMLADKGDASEEITRLSAYLDRLDEMLGGDGAAGKRLDFTLQEAFREINTLGSKSRDVPVSALVVEMKSELERMKEQAANVE